MSFDAISQARTACGAAAGSSIRRGAGRGAAGVADELAAVMKGSEGSVDGAATAGTTLRAGGAGGTGLLPGNPHVHSGVETTLPNGLTLGLFRFDFAPDSAAADLGTAPDAAPPTLQDRRDDLKMFDGFEQMADYFDFRPDKEDIELTGTAAPWCRGDISTLR